MPALSNLFQERPDASQTEVFEALAESPGVLIERIVSAGQSTPEGEWLRQERAEWVTLLEGLATLEFANGRVVQMAPGDHLLIGSQERHRVSQCSNPALWLAVHFDTST